MHKEQLIRKVTPIGNGAHIFVPKDWLDDEVVLIRVPKQPIEAKILKVLKPYLENIEGVFLYGSYARNEQSKDSDIDILVIANKKLSIKQDNYEIIVLEEKNIEKAIEISPLLIYSALAEARPIINSKLFEKLKSKYKIQDKHVRNYLRQTKEIIKVNEEFPSLYSLMLRLRGVYLVNQLLSGKNYSNEKFKSWLLRHSSNLDVEKIKNYKEDYVLSDKEANSLLILLKDKVKEVEVKIGKTGKEA